MGYRNTVLRQIDRKARPPIEVTEEARQALRRGSVGVEVTLPSQTWVQIVDALSRFAPTTHDRQHYTRRIALSDPWHPDRRLGSTTVRQMVYEWRGLIRILVNVRPESTPLIIAAKTMTDAIDEALNKE